MMAHADGSILRDNLLEEKAGWLGRPSKERESKLSLVKLANFDTTPPIHDTWEALICASAIQIFAKIQPESD